MATAIERHHAAVEHHHDDHHHHVIEFTPAQRLSMNRLGLWLFLISETFLFAGILVARIVLLRDASGSFTRPELDQGIGLVITFILLLSSFAVYTGETAISRGEIGRFKLGIGAAIVMGLIFTLGVGYEWSIAHFKPSDGVEGGMFFFMTGMHALHVLTGLIFLMIVYWNGQRGNYSKASHWGVEASALYWHFVDVVWVFFYVALYLIGHVPEVH